MSARRFRVSILPIDRPTRLDPAESHHLVHVLRLGPGAPLVVFDGQGSQVACVVLSIEDGVVIEAVGPVEAMAPTQAAHLVLALLKPKALDLALRMAVEAGITHLHIFTADRSQQRPARMDRWAKIAEAAAKQCGRSDLPQIAVYDSLDSALSSVDATLYIALPGAPERPELTRPAAAIIGPEGGFTPSEVTAALSAGAQPLGLGRWVLRAETAAILASGYVVSSG